MSVWSLFVVLGNPNGMIAIVTKNTKISFQYTIARLVIMSIVIYLVGRHSIIAAAMSMLIVYFIMFFVNWRILLKRILNVSLREYLNSFVRFLLVVLLISIGCNAIVGLNLFSIPNALFQFLIYGFIYFSIIAVYFFLFERTLLFEVKRVLLQR